MDLGGDGNCPMKGTSACLSGHAYPVYELNYLDVCGLMSQEWHDKLGLLGERMRVVCLVTLDHVAAP